MTRFMWDQRYGEPGYAYGTEPNDFLAEVAELHLPSGGEVVSLAEGEGRNAVHLARRGFRVTAVDGSAVGLAKAEALAREHGVHLDTVATDLADFDLGESRWDGVVSIWCHVDPDLRARLHRGIVRALRPGGVLILESYTPDQLKLRTGGPPRADLMTTLAEARASLAGLDFVVAEEKLREVREGKYHQGTSAVVQIVARKP